MLAHTSTQRGRPQREAHSTRISAMETNKNMCASRRELEECRDAEMRPSSWAQMRRISGRKIKNMSERKKHASCVRAILKRRCVMKVACIRVFNTWVELWLMHMILRMRARNAHHKTACDIVPPQERTTAANSHFQETCVRRAEQVRTNTPHRVLRFPNRTKKQKPALLRRPKSATVKFLDWEIDRVGAEIDARSAS